MAKSDDSEISHLDKVDSIVSWDGDDDPENPMNWSLSYRCTIVGLVTISTFISGTSSAMFAPGVPDLLQEFNSTNTVLGSFSVTIFVLGLATGPIIFAPCSELYGRLIVQHVGNIGFLIFTIACALSNSLGMLIVFRLLQGTFGSVPLINGGSVIADLIVLQRRGLAMTIFTVGIYLGPVVGPVTGGLITNAKDWRWVFWVLAIPQGALTILNFVLWRHETYPNVLLARKAAHLRSKFGNPNLCSKFENGLTSKQYFTRGILRMMRMLALSPIVLCLSIYVGLVYSYFYLLITTITPLFQGTYGFKSDIVGLSYLGLGLGFLLGQAAFATSSDKLVQRLAKKMGGVIEPEYRLPPAMIGGVFVPVSFFLYGWSAQAKTHWIVPIMGTSFLGFGQALIFMSVQTYLINAYTTYAASALGANTLVRSVMAAVLPLAAPKMYESMGLGWANSLLAFLALTMFPFPFIFFKYGERMRGLAAAKRLNAD